VIFLKEHTTINTRLMCSLFVSRDKYTLDVFVVCVPRTQATNTLFVSSGHTQRTHKACIDVFVVCVPRTQTTDTSSVYLRTQTTNTSSVYLLTINTRLMCSQINTPLMCSHIVNKYALDVFAHRVSHVLL
jgi:hypothetical protein